MDQHDIEMTNSDALAALSWQIEMGADEAILDAPIDRYQAVQDQIAAKSAATQAVVASAVKKATQPQSQNTLKTSAMPATAPLGAAEAIAAAESAAKECSSLQDLKNAINQFDGLSALKRSATQTVFGDGSETADVMIIGEAPGREDDASGVAFSGPTGQMLDKMFGAIALTRENFHVTNMIYWRPPGDRSPSDSEIAVFKPFLDKHIQLINPKILIFMGAKPAQTLLKQTSGISRLRGKWLECNINGIDNVLPSMAMFHPASLIKNPSQKRLAWHDLLSIQQKLK